MPLGTVYRSRVPSVALEVIVTVLLIMSIGLSVHRVQALRAAGRPLPTSTKVSFVGYGVVAVGLVVLIVAAANGI